MWRRSLAPWIASRMQAKTTRPTIYRMFFASVAGHPKSSRALGKVAMSHDQKAAEQPGYRRDDIVVGVGRHPRYSHGCAFDESNQEGADARQDHADAESVPGMSAWRSDDVQGKFQSYPERD
jgi:hypothetical protein